MPSTCASGRRRARSRRRRAAPNALLHTRLSIIDPRPEADQPMDNAAGDVWISYNGEVYDWAADAETLKAAGLRLPHALGHRVHPARLRALGHRLRLAAARHVRDRDPRSARGARVYVVRDRLGLKPVVYAHRDDGFAFASTTRALLPWLPRDARGVLRRRHRRVSRAPDDSRAAHDLRRRSRGCRPRTGCATISRRGTLETREYWRPEPSAEPWLADARCGDPDAHGRRPSARTLPVVGRRFVRDRLPARGDGLQPPAELHRRVSRHAVRRNADSRAPPPSGSASPTSRSTIPDAHRRRLRAPRRRSRRAVRRSVVRADVVSRARDDAPREGRAGRRWRRRALRRLQALCEAPAHALAARPRAARSARAGGASAAAAGSAASRSCGSTGAPRTRCASRASRPASARSLAPEAAPPAHYWRMPDSDGDADLPTLLEIDRLNYLPDYILRKADLCTMAHGLEMRAPFLDHRFVGAVLALPDAARFTTPPRQAARAGDGGARRSRSVRAQEARLQSAARRLARRRSRAAAAGHRRRGSRSCRAACSTLRASTRSSLPGATRKTGLRRAGAAARAARRIAGAARRARGAGRRRLSPAATGGETAPPAQDTGRQCDRAQNAGRAPPVSDRDRASARGA